MSNHHDNDAIAGEITRLAIRDNCKSDDGATSLLDDPFLQTTNASRKKLGFQAIGRSTEGDKVGGNNPPCDACGKDGGALLLCQRCVSVFYCSKDCQVHHWKHGGHKKACEHLKQQAESAVHVMEQIHKVENPMLKVRLLERIDGTGPYNVAVREGLFGAMIDIFAADEKLILERFQSATGPIFCGTMSIMSTIFPRQQREGKEDKGGGSFRFVDGKRIRKFVESDPVAFRTWFGASLAVLWTAMDDTVYRLSKQSQQYARHAARDVWAGWIMVFTNESASKTILVGTSETAKESMDTVNYIVNKIKKFLHAYWDMPYTDRKDPGGTLEGVMNQVAAMVAYWAQVFSIPLEVSVEDMLEFTTFRRHRYRSMAVPLAEGTIAKGCMLTNDEAKVAMLQAASCNPLVSEKKARKGKKKRK